MPDWQIILNGLSTEDYVLYKNQLWKIFDMHAGFFECVVGLRRCSDSIKEDIRDADIENIRKVNFIDLWELKRNSK